MEQEAITLQSCHSVQCSPSEFDTSRFPLVNEEATNPNALSDLILVMDMLQPMNNLPTLTSVRRPVHSLHHHSSSQHDVWVCWMKDNVSDACTPLIAIYDESIPVHIARS